MNGWWRIGIVIAGLVSCFVALIGWANAERGQAYYLPPPRMSPIIQGAAPETTAQALWREHKDMPDLKGCVPETVTVSENASTSTYDLYCEKGFKAKLRGALEYALYPFIVLLILGGIITWIYRGFRPKK